MSIHNLIEFMRCGFTFAHNLFQSSLSSLVTHSTPPLPPTQRFLASNSNSTLVSGAPSDQDSSVSNSSVQLRYNDRNLCKYI